MEEARFAWTKDMNTGVWQDHTGTRFCWDGLEVTAEEFMNRVRAAIVKATEDERERCAKIAEAAAGDFDIARSGGLSIAKTIREAQ